MTSEFNHASKQIADNIIDISVLLKDRMESWADVFVRIPDSQNVNVTAGFITNWTQPNVVEVLVEVQAPANSTEALIRTQIISAIKDSDGNERFNQVSLHYSADYPQARQLVEKGGSTTRDDIARLLHAEDSRLVRVTVSDDTGKDSSSQQLLGTRYDFDDGELAAIAEETESELSAIMDVVLSKLRSTSEQQARI
jgi:hypothetical protein